MLKEAFVNLPFDELGYIQLNIHINEYGILKMFVRYAPDDENQQLEDLEIKYSNDPEDETQIREDRAYYRPDQASDY